MAMRNERKPRGAKREIGFEQALELQERLVVEDDVVDVVELDAGLRRGNTAIALCGKAGIVLLAREALLLRGRDDLAVLDQRRGAVVIEGRNPEDAHGGADPV